MRDTVPLTHLEQRVLAAIESHFATRGESPTIAELAGSLHLKSRGTVHRYVQSLIDKGRLERRGTGWRGLRVVGSSPSPVVPAHSPATASATASATAPQSTAPPAGLVALPVDGYTSGDFRIPLLGRIAAGLPIEAIEDENHLDLAAFFIGPDRYALRVTGDSMVDVGILDGDTVILRKTSTARRGDIVVALIDGHEATLKRLGSCQNGVVELIPENTSMQPMRYNASRVSFQGVLVGQLRSY